MDLDKVLEEKFGETEISMLENSEIIFSGKSRIYSNDNELVPGNYGGSKYYNWRNTLGYKKKKSITKLKKKGTAE
jgi:hypothetical protein